MLLQLGERARHTAARDVIAMRIESKTNLADLARDEGALGGRYQSDSNIGLSFQKILGGVGEYKFNGNSRVFGAEARQYRRHQFGADQFRHGYADRAASFLRAT